MSTVKLVSGISVVAVLVWAGGALFTFKTYDSSTPDRSETPAYQRYSPSPGVKSVEVDGSADGREARTVNVASTGQALRLPPDDDAEFFHLLLSDKDFFGTVEQEYPSALAGDAHSMFRVWMLMDSCAQSRRLILARSFSEFLATQENGSSEFIERTRRMYATCETLVQPVNWSKFEGWEAMLTGASKKGHAVATLYEAFQLMRHADNAEEIQSLLDQSIRSGEPRVYFLLAGAVAALPDTDTLESSSWALLSCKLGFECNEPIPEVNVVCSFDSSCNRDESINSALLRELGQYEFDMANQRAEAMAVVAQQCGFDCLEIPESLRTYLAGSGPEDIE